MHEAQPDWQDEVPKGLAYLLRAEFCAHFVNAMESPDIQNPRHPLCICQIDLRTHLLFNKMLLIDFMI